MKKRAQRPSALADDEALPWDTAGSTDKSQFEKTATRIHEQMLAELDLIDREQSEAASWSEIRLKQLTAFFKALQGMEEMLGRFEEKRDRRSQDDRDILEFRQELEKRIAGFVEQREGAPISG